MNEGSENSVVDLGKPHSYNDPFTQRTGKTLTWRNINMTVKKKGEEKVILSDVYGEVPAKQICAILGPSGSGKTSLLNILSGRVKSKRNMDISKDVRLNNFLVDPSKVAVRQQIAFVAQDDSLQVTSTPRECIRFSAKLRLPRSMTDEDLDSLTERMLKELGLQSCADTIIGGPLLKGCSGGQRKRTSVAVELVVRPSIIFLDEPTSGLDSYSAMQLVKVLKKVAGAGASVLFTIHQPSGEVYESFDQVILLNKGSVMAQGDTDEMFSFFEDNGYPMPLHYNPADWIIDVAQATPKQELIECGFFPDNLKPYSNPSNPQESDKDVDLLGRSIANEDIHSDDKVSFCTQVTMLLQREWRNVIRNKKALATRFVFTIFMAFLVGIIFWDIGKRELNQFQNVQSRFGGMIMVLMLGMFGTAQPSLLAFPEERPVFLREYSTNHYSVGSYFISRFLIEAVVTFCQMVVQTIICYYCLSLDMNIVLFFAIIYVLAMAATAVAVLLGCLVTDPKMGQEFLPVLFVPQLLFAGFFVPTDFIPIWLRWAQYLCSLTFAVRLMLDGEFRECSNASIAQGEQGNMPMMNPCEQLLTISNVDQLPMFVYWIILIGIFVFFRVAALVVLKKKALTYL